MPCIGKKANDPGATRKGRFCLIGLEIENSEGICDSIRLLSR